MNNSNLFPESLPPIITKMAQQPLVLYAINQARIESKRGHCPEEHFVDEALVSAYTTLAQHAAAKARCVTLTEELNKNEANWRERFRSIAMRLYTPQWFSEERDRIVHILSTTYPFAESKDEHGFDDGIYEGGTHKGWLMKEELIENLVRDHTAFNVLEMVVQAVAYVMYAQKYQVNLTEVFPGHPAFKAAKKARIRL